MTSPSPAPALGDDLLPVTLQLCEHCGSEGKSTPRAMAGMTRTCGR